MVCKKKLCISIKFHFRFNLKWKIKKTSPLNCNWPPRHEKNKKQCPETKISERPTSHEKRLYQSSRCSCLGFRKIKKMLPVLQNPYFSKNQKKCSNMFVTQRSFVPRIRFVGHLMPRRIWGFVCVGAEIHFRPEFFQQANKKNGSGKNGPNRGGCSPHIPPPPGKYAYDVVYS